MTDIPRVLGNRYEVGELIGRGGMAEVHIGYDTRLSRTVAIKVLRSDLASDPTFLARFRREAQSAAALNHPSIVAVYDTGEEHTITPNGNELSLPYIVMEYVKGRTVSKLLNNGDALPINEAVQIVVGVLSALEYSHREGIIHRDIKPGNIMLTPDGKVKVMDFGIARAVADSAATMTQTNSVIGTAQYLSPEQARGEVVDTRSDLYSTGCVLYELLTGKPPFQGDSAVAVAYQHVSEPAKPTQSIAPDIPDALDRVVMKSLAKRREDRYQTAAEMRADLLAASRGEGVDAPDVNSWQTRVLPASVVPAAAGAVAASTPPDAVAVTSTATTAAVVTEDDAERQRKRNIAYIVIGVLLLLLALGGIGWAILNQNDEPDDPVTSTAEMVTVPDLTGMDQNQARAALEAEGLTMNLAPAVEDDSIPAGQFVSSMPGPGESVEKGTTVEVSFSSGVGEVEVPDLTNGKYDQESARRALEAAGLKVGNVETEDAPGVEAGTVVSTDPAPGTRVAKGTEVSLVIASDEVEVPDVTTGDFNQESARRALEDAGLRVGDVRSEDAAGVGANIVVSTNPEPGTQVSKDSEVQLVVASGKINLTDVRGMNVNDAEKILREELKLQTISISEEDNVMYDPGTVISMTPTPGSQDYNIEVSLVVAREPAPTEDPVEETPTGDDPAGSNGEANSGNANAGPGRNSGNN